MARQTQRTTPRARGGLAADAGARARELAGAQPPERRAAFARALCAAVLARFWAGLGAREPLRTCPPGQDAELPGEAMAVAVRLAERARALDVDAAGYLVGRTYAAMLPAELRAANGVFYTPPAVVARLLERAGAAGVDWSRARVLDPACGGGAFLGPLARRMIAGRTGRDRREVLRDLATRLAGHEIDPFAAWMAAVFLDATLHAELGAAGDESFAPVEVRDSLARPEPADFDLVIGNPPYGRVTLSAAARELYGRSLFGHANLYGLFLDLALRKARPDGGVLAFVTPTGFLCGEYFKNLRGLLGGAAPPVTLDFIHQREGVFDDVLQETLLAVFRRGAPAASFGVCHVDFAGGAARTTCDGAARLPDDPMRPWIVARAPAAAPLAARLQGLTTRLADWGYGVSTGPLVWNRHKPKLCAGPRAGAVPVVWAEAVGAAGALEFPAERHRDARYLVVGPRDDALLVRRPCVLLRRTTAKEQTRRLIAAELPQAFLDAHGGAVTVENHVNMVRPIAPAPTVATRALAAFLNSAAADRAFRCISGTVAVSAYELEAMPLPPAGALAELAALLAGPHRPEDVERCCERLYGDA